MDFRLVCRPLGNDRSLNGTQIPPNLDLRRITSRWRTIVNRGRSETTIPASTSSHRIENIMRKTKNITVAASERSYYEARVYAARYGLSLSAAVGFLLNNLPLISQAVKDLRAKDPNFGSDPARLPYGKRA